MSASHLFQIFVGIGRLSQTKPARMRDGVSFLSVTDKPLGHFATAGIVTAGSCAGREEDDDGGQEADGEGQDNSFHCGKLLNVYHLPVEGTVGWVAFQRIE